MAVTYEGKGTYTKGTDALTVPLPSGVAEGDLLILVAEGYGNYPSTPSGWTSIKTSNCPYDESNVAWIRVCYKIAGASEGSVSVDDSGNSTRAIVLRFTGHDPDTPIGSSTAGSDGLTPYVFSCGYNTTINGSIVVCALGLWNTGKSAGTATFSSWTNTNLDNITEIHDEYDTTGSDGGIGIAYGVKTTAGSVGNYGVTSSENNNQISFITFVINPLTDQTLSLTGIASTAAIGTLTLVPGNKNLALTGIASGAQIGTLTMVPGNFNLALTGIPSGAQIGTLTMVPGNFNLALTGIPSGVQFGTLTLVPGPVVMELSGIPPGAQFGTLTLQGDVILALVGIASTVQFGELTLKIPFIPLQIALAILERTTTLTQSENASDGTESSGVILLALTEQRPTLGQSIMAKSVSLSEMPLTLEQELLSTVLEVE